MILRLNWPEKAKRIKNVNRPLRTKCQYSECFVTGIFIIHLNGRSKSMETIEKIHGNTYGRNSINLLIENSEKLYSVRNVSLNLKNKDKYFEQILYRLVERSNCCSFLSKNKATSRKQKRTVHTFVQYRNCDLCP